ncbi:MAG: oxidoreductase [Thermodesulfobacteriota bacterium]|nr:oxidoreductase [Thermodesulfobacteriota bacterium]
MPLTTWIAGATGLTGGILLNRLIADIQYQPVIAPTRRDLAPAPGLQNPVNPNILDGISPYTSCDHAFCCLGTTIKTAGSKPAFHAIDHDLCLDFARLAHTSGCRHFLLISAIGANPGSRIFYNRTKGQLEQALRQLSFPRLSIFQPSLLLGQRPQFRLLEELGQKAVKLANPILHGPLSPYHPIPTATLAAAMHHTAQTAPIPDQPVTRIYQYKQIIAHASA